MTGPAWYAASVPVFLRYLARLRHWLDIAQAQQADGAGAAQALLQARLASDMLDFQTQVAVAANFALRTCFPLAGQPVPPYGEFANDFEGLRARIEHVVALLASLPVERFDGAGSRTLESRAGDALVRLPATEFLTQYALPNFFFHLTAAYAILRSRGVPLGKADFDGFHDYPAVRRAAPGPATSDEPRAVEHLQALERSRLRALVAQDMAAARPIHAVDFQLVTPAGRAFTRDEYLGKVEAGALRYLRWEPGPIAVRLHGESAVMRYQATLELDGGDGHGAPFQCWHIDTYERIDGRWQVVWSQATLVKP